MHTGCLLLPVVGTRKCTQCKLVPWNECMRKSIYIGRRGRNMMLAYVIHIESEGFRGTVAQSVLSYIPGLAGGVQASYM